MVKSAAIRGASLYPGSTLGESSLPLTTTHRQMIISAAPKEGAYGGKKNAHSERLSPKHLRE
jgi:hypothetical protein